MSTLVSLLCLLLLLLALTIDFTQGFSIDKRANPWFMRPAWRAAQKKSYYMPAGAVFWPDTN
ncbi:hypothetical protein PRIPAC_75827 [Pristionchus pacificus]|uniref:Uncharacterized protein n=1 Tax=Pristionchus pacificus TaxID=54126 RepID=A0A2A6CQQ7_PRIPA|nr:hypothetical protein PRIPAC_75827 [Pristionchus pacificus]|eukprot:PDM80554.1 hypothetical protein PRIPAC_35557 [Pristionchus pacificus]